MDFLIKHGKDGISKLDDDDGGKRFNIVYPLDLQCLLKPYNDYDIQFLQSKEIEQWNLMMFNNQSKHFRLIN